MSPAHVLEPTYQRIRRCLTDAEWPPGFRLDTARLAAALGVSTSPVRDSLNRLAGERFVDFTHGSGFHVPRIEERQLIELLELNLLLLTAAIACETFWNEGVSSEAKDGKCLVRCFRTIARASCNGELVDAIDRTSGRLAPVLRYDDAIMGDRAAEVDALQVAILDDDMALLRTLVRQCHEARIAKAGAYIGLLRTAGVNPRPSL